MRTKGKSSTTSFFDSRWASFVDWPSDGAACPAGDRRARRRDLKDPVDWFRIASRYEMFEKLKSIPTHMDYEGQKKAEKIFQTVILLAAVIGFLAGYISQQFSHTVYFLAAGFVICCILTLPPWSMYRTKPLQWLKPLPEESSEGTPTSGSKKQKKK